MTAAQLQELKARLLYLRELSLMYSPHFIQRDMHAGWADVLEIVGAADEAAAREAMRESAPDMFAELWGPC